jgi:hypothetical protein
MPLGNVDDTEHDMQQGRRLSRTTSAQFGAMVWGMGYSELHISEDDTDEIAICPCVYSFPSFIFFNTKIQNQYSGL